MFIVDDFWFFANGLKLLGASFGYKCITVLCLRAKFRVLGDLCERGIGDFPDSDPLALSRLTELFFFFCFT